MRYSSSRDHFHIWASVNRWKFVWAYWSVGDSVSTYYGDENFPVVLLGYELGIFVWDFRSLVKRRKLHILFERQWSSAIELARSPPTTAVKWTVEIDIIDGADIGTLFILSLICQLLAVIAASSPWISWKNTVRGREKMLRLWRKDWYFIVWITRPMWVHAPYRYYRER